VITNLLSEGFFLLWWNDVVVLSNLIPEDIAERIVSLAPLWEAYFWPLNIIVGALFILHFYVLVRGVWQRHALLAELVGNVACLGVAAVLLTSGDLVMLNDSFSPEFENNVQRSVQLSILVICGFVVWDMWLALRTFRGAMSGLRTRH
jgi:hypothetical protein